MSERAWSERPRAPSRRRVSYRPSSRPTSYFSSIGRSSPSSGSDIESSSFLSFLLLELPLLLLLFLLRCFFFFSPPSASAPSLSFLRCFFFFSPPSASPVEVPSLSFLLRCFFFFSPPSASPVEAPSLSFLLRCFFFSPPSAASPSLCFLLRCFFSPPSAASLLVAAAATWSLSLSVSAIESARGARRERCKATKPQNNRRNNNNKQQQQPPPPNTHRREGIEVGASERAREREEARVRERRRGETTRTRRTTKHRRTTTSASDLSLPPSSLNHSPCSLSSSATAPPWHHRSHGSPLRSACRLASRRPWRYAKRRATEPTIVASGARTLPNFAIAL